MTGEEKIRRVDEYLGRAATTQINNNLTNIKKALAMVLLKVPDDVREDFMNQGDPVVIVEGQNVAGTVGFYTEQTGLDFQKGVRILTIEEKVNKYPLRIIMGVLAHEFAHLYLHSKPSVPALPENEIKADQLVEKWPLNEYLLEARRVLTLEKTTFRCGETGAMHLRNLTYGGFREREEYKYCGSCGREFRDEDKVAVLSGTWGALLVSHSVDEIKEFFRTRRYQDYPEKLMGLTLKLRVPITVPRADREITGATDIHCFDSCNRNGTVILRVKTAEGIPFEATADNFRVVIAEEEIDLC